MRLTGRFASLILHPALLTVLCALGAGTSAAHAQTATWNDRAYVNGNVSLQLTVRPFDERLAPIIYAERAVLDAAHPGEGGKPVAEPAAGIRLFKNVGVGGAYSQRTVAESLTVKAIVPHPLLFNQPRLASKAAPFERSDTAIHAHLLYMLPVTPRLDVAIMAGPSFIRVQQQMLNGIEVAEGDAPFTAVAIGNVDILTREARTVGAHAAADVTWFVTPLVGIGVTARYVLGSATMRTADGTAVDLNVGGLQIAWGARLRLR
ncbi:MAG: hypothetical protein AB7O32_03440 [Vicinamibacterales bacterium]